MKPHFAKWLPAEGRIREGDYFESYLLKGEYEKADTKDKAEYAKDLQKVKLFLCSRDIQVGDSYYNTDYNTYRVVKSFGTTSPNIVHFDDSSLFDYRKDCIKVIGEISPEAVWVKEGDEFDEEEVSNSLFIRQIIPNRSDLKVNIKCRCCGKFN